jgi:hypothetical protein
MFLEQNCFEQKLKKMIYFVSTTFFSKSSAFCQNYKKQSECSKLLDCAYIFELVRPFEQTGRLQNVGFEVLTVVVMKSSIFWHVLVCSILKVSQWFGGMCHLHLGLFFNHEDGGDLFL